MDIEKLINRLNADAADWAGDRYIKRDLLDAADALEKLQAELEQAKQERDAAVESIPHECKTCLYHTVFFNGCTPDHDCINPDGGCSNNYDRWEWRGQKEDGHETDD